MNAPTAASVSAPETTPATPDALPARSRLSILAGLTKPRLNVLVLLSVAAGFTLGTPLGPLSEFRWDRLLHVLVGVFFTASGASVLNQVIEMSRDARMPRTANRPLVEGRIGRVEALVFGLVLGLGGMTYLVLASNKVAAGLAGLTMLLYLLVYTPLKHRTELNTLIGAFPGALPTLIGWEAAERLNAQAGTLFAILFLWQLPHFFAIAWIYRKDYAQGGFKMLPVVNPDGKSTGRRAVVYALLLLLIVWTPTTLALTGLAYAIGSVALTLGYVGFALHFAIKRTDASARRLFLYSVLYLFVLLALMILDKVKVSA